MIRILSITAIMFLLCCSFAVAEDGLAVIVNKDNLRSIDKGMIAKIYLGELSRWPGKGTIIAYEPPEDSPTAVSFYAKVIGKPLKKIKEIWAQNVFTGKALPPITGASDEEVKRAVARHKSAIGYVKASAVDASVRVVVTIP